MRKLLSYLIPIVSIIVFIIVMQGGCYFMYSRSNREAVPNYISQIETDLKAGHWDNARDNLLGLDQAWKKLIPGIQLHAEMDAIDGIKENIARLNGSIAAQDLGLALSEINELSEHWENLKN